MLKCLFLEGDNFCSSSFETSEQERQFLKVVELNPVPDKNSLTRFLKDPPVRFAFTKREILLQRKHPVFSAAWTRDLQWGWIDDHCADFQIGLRELSFHQ